MLGFGISISGMRMLPDVMAGQAELTNFGGGFSDLTGVSSLGATVTLDGNEVRITSTSSDGADRGQFSISGLVIGNWYRAVIVAREVTAHGNGRIQSWSIADIGSYSFGTAKTEIPITFKATAASGLIRVYSSSIAAPAGQEVIVSSISVKHIPGYNPS